MSDRTLQKDYGDVKLYYYAEIVEIETKYAVTKVPYANLKDFIAKVDQPLIVDTKALDAVVACYRNNIRFGARLTALAKKKVLSRLKQYPPEHLAVAIAVFATDEWQMKHNSHRGMAWFFRNDDAIDALLNKEEYQAPAYVDDSKCPNCHRMMARKIFRPEAAEVSKKWWDVPIYYCDSCHYHHAYNPVTVPTNDLLLGRAAGGQAARGDGLPPLLQETL